MRAEVRRGADADFAVCFFLATLEAASAPEGKQRAATTQKSAAEANFDKDSTSTSAHTVSAVYGKEKVGARSTTYRIVFK
jgi:hypothetical protein